MVRPRPDPEAQVTTVLDPSRPRQWLVLLRHRRSLAEVLHCWPNPSPLRRALSRIHTPLEFVAEQELQQEGVGELLGMGTCRHRAMGDERVQQQWPMPWLVRTEGAGLWRMPLRDHRQYQQQGLWARAVV